MDDKKADKTQIYELNEKLHDFNNKLEHMSVFAKELSAIILPQ